MMVTLLRLPRANLCSLGVSTEAREGRVASAVDEARKTATGAQAALVDREAPGVDPGPAAAQADRINASLT